MLHAKFQEHRTSGSVWYSFVHFVRSRDQVTVSPSRSSVHRFMGLTSTKQRVNVTYSMPQRTVHRPGLEPGTPWSEIRRPNHCASPPPVWRRRILKVFTIYGHGGRLGHVTWTIYTNFLCSLPTCCQFLFDLYLAFGFPDKVLVLIALFPGHLNAMFKGVTHLAVIAFITTNKAYVHKILSGNVVE